MPLLTRIREGMTTIFAVFAGVFIVYIVLDWGMDLSSTKQATRANEAQMVGFVNGEGISFREFSEFVQQTVDNQRAQTGVEPNEQQTKIFRDQVWDNMVTNRLYNHEIDRLSLAVTDQEIVDAVRGDNPPAFLRAQFTDSTGTFNRQAYDAALSDPRNRPIMVQLEQAIREQRLRDKLQSIVLAGVAVSETDVLRKFTEDNVTYNLEYILIDPNRFVPDSAVTVTDEDLRAAYDRDIRTYRVEATRKVKYVRFPEVASADDTGYVRGEMEDILKRAGEGADFEELATANSMVPSTDVFFAHGELTPEKEVAVFAARAGDIVGPILERDGYHLIKVLEFQQGAEEFIHAQHVLVSIENGNDAAALQEANEILKKAKAGEDIGQLAAEYSDEPGADVRKGDLGWFGRSRMVKPFEDAVFKATPGQTIGPVKTEFGYHVIRVIAKDRRKVKIRDIQMRIEISPKTKSDIYQKAQDFAYFARENGFEKEAELDKYTVSETPSFQRQGSIPGLGNIPALNRFAFEGTAGDISEAISITNGYGVFTISEMKDAGVKPFDEVKTSVGTLVKREKKKERTLELAGGIRDALQPGDGLDIITASHPQLTVQKFEEFVLGGPEGQRVGRDPALLGAIEALPPGEISKPVPGTRGVYIIRLLQKSAPDTSLYSAQRQQIYLQLLQEKRDRFFNEWTIALKNSAEIVDNRDFFYR